MHLGPSRHTEKPRLGSHSRRSYYRCRLYQSQLHRIISRSSQRRHGHMHHKPPNRPRTRTQLDSRREQIAHHAAYYTEYLCWIPICCQVNIPPPPLQETQDPTALTHSALDIPIVHQSLEPNPKSSKPFKRHRWNILRSIMAYSSTTMVRRAWA
jgi:hypothetical protein